jgi:hypothetical protein
MASTQEQRPDETSAGATTTRTTTRKRSRSAQAPATPDRTSAAHGPYLLPALPDGPFVVKPEDVERLEVSIMPDGVLFVRGTRERLEAFVAACQTEGISLIIDHASMCG